MARAQLCATVTAETTAQLRTRRDAVIGADLVELRVDGVRDLDLEGAVDFLMWMGQLRWAEKEPKDMVLVELKNQGGRTQCQSWISTRGAEKKGVF